MFCGVLQCFVLRPLLLTLFNTPLNSLIHSHKLDHRLYADVTHVYTSLFTHQFYTTLKLCTIAYQAFYSTKAQRVPFIWLLLAI